jgi:hypothetical protein
MGLFAGRPAGIDVGNNRFSEVPARLSWSLAVASHPGGSLDGSPLSPPSVLPAPIFERIGTHE